MKDVKAYEQDLSTIRSMMERSVKFISLSGLSGVLAGIYALTGAAIAWYLLRDRRLEINDDGDTGNSYNYVTDDPSLVLQLITLAAIVLTASLLTGLYFSNRKAKKYNSSLWNATSQRLFTTLAVPLVTGGILVLIITYAGYYELIAPLMLIFYGLALFHGSQYTFEEVRYLGLTEIILGIIAMFLPGYGIFCWAIGFGLMHIIYGGFMYYRHEQ
jgi:hypothetical protein